MKKSIKTAQRKAQKKAGQALAHLIHITKHSGKLEGLCSISTSRRLNPYCMERAKDPRSICYYCYAETYLKLREALRLALERNTEVLTGSILPAEALPLINAAYFRFEAFGDLINETQVINYFNICRKNKACRFGLWTKNPWIIKKAIEQGHSKPRNLNIVYSVSGLNNGLTPLGLEIVKTLYPFIDKFFTVYTKKHLKANGLGDDFINCGGRKCLECLKCYKKGGPEFINELKK